MLPTNEMLYPQNFQPFQKNINNPQKTNNFHHWSYHEKYAVESKKQCKETKFV